MTAPAVAGGRLCVLGAGNCQDLDLERLTASYQAVHLVDLDEQALERAYERQSAPVRDRIVRHAGLDLSGLCARLPAWVELRVGEREVLEHAGRTAEAVSNALGGKFECVVSTCVLSQMQLAARKVLSDSHPLFDVACHTLTLTHLRTLSRLTAPGGRAILVSDVSSDELAPLRGADPASDLRPLLASLCDGNRVFHAVDPRRVVGVMADDPALRWELALASAPDAWLWHNGPKRTFLVYALVLERRGVRAPRGDASAGAAAPRAEQRLLGPE